MSETEGQSESRFGFLKQNTIGKADVFLFGTGCIMSGAVSGWADVNEHGFWILISATIVPSIGYLILTFCIAEMTSALPFSGGIYGFVRAFTSPMFGFIVAVFELMVNVFYVSPMIYLLASLPVNSENSDRPYILFGCFCVYVSILAVTLLGGKIFWFVSNSLGVVVLGLTLTYIIASCTYANFDRWGRGTHYHSFEIFEFMKHIPFISTVYIGISFLPLTSRYVPNAKQDIPIVMVSLMCLLILTTFGIFVTSCSQFPGIDALALELFPLTIGFSKIFNINEGKASWINMIYLYATAFTFIYCCGRQASVMSGSKVIPEIFSRTIPGLDTPYVSLITFVMFSFLLNIIMYFYEEMIPHFFLVTSLSTFIVYFFALIGYVSFHKKYSTLDRYFRSPLGLPGAYLGIVIFVFCFVGGFAFQDENYIAIVIIISIALFSIIYFIFFSGEQSFSEEEKEQLFKAYIMNGKRDLLIHVNILFNLPLSSSFDS